MKREELDAIRKRADETSFSSAYIKGDPWKGYEVKDEGNGIVIAETSTKADAEFIANARQDVPALLAEVERLRGELETANKAAVSAVGLLGKLQRERESDFDWDIGY